MELRVPKGPEDCSVGAVGAVVVETVPKSALTQPVRRCCRSAPDPGRPGTPSSRLGVTGLLSSDKFESMEGELNVPFRLVSCAIGLGSASLV